MAVKQSDLERMGLKASQIAAGAPKSGSLAKSAVDAAKAKKAAATQAQAILASSTTTPEQKAQAQKLLNPKKPSFLASALGDVAGSPVGKGVMGLLDAADTARAFVVSGVSETSDLLTDAFNLPGHEYVDASWGEFVKQGRDNIGVGTAFREKAAAKAAAGSNKVFGVKVFENPDALASAPKGSAAFKEWLKSQDGGKQLKYTKGGKALGIGVGAVGDIGLDPLTYLTMGGEKFAGMSAESIGDAALKAGRADIAQKAVTKGKWALSAQELEVIGLAGEGGLHFRQPGTGAIGRTVGKVIPGVSPKTLDEAGNLVRQEIRSAAIPGTTNLMKHTPVGLYQSARASMRTQIGEHALSAAFGGKFNTLKDAMFKGTPEDFKNAFATIQGDRVAVGWEKTFANDVERKFSQLEAKAHKLGVSGEDLYHALGDPENQHEATKRIMAVAGDGGADGIALLNDFRDFAHAYLPNSVNEHAGADVIANLREGWQPSKRPKATRDYLIETYGERAGRLGTTPLNSKDLPAEIVKDGEFMGERLVSVADSKAIYGKTLEPREQAMEILKQKMAVLGEDKVLAMFDEDVFSAMPASIRNYANRVYKARMERELLGRGVATKLTRIVNDPTATVALHVQAQVDKRLADMRLAMKATSAAADAADDVAVKASTRARVITNIAESARARRAKAIADLKNASDVLDGVANDISLIHSAEYATHEVTASAARLEMVKLQGEMGALLREREGLLAKASARRAMTDESIAIQSKIAEIEAQLSSKAGGAYSRFRTIEPDIAHFSGKLEQLRQGRKIAEKTLETEARAAYANGGRVGDTAAVADFVVEIDKGRAFLENTFGSKLKSQSTGQILNDLKTVEAKVNEHLSLLQDTKASLETVLRSDPQVGAQFAQLSTLQERALQLGDQASAEQLAYLQRSLPQVDGTALVNPLNESGMWHLGDITRIDATSPGGWRAGAAATENGLGVRLTQSPSMGAQTAEVVVKVSNPKVYGHERLLDLAWDHRQFAAYGTTAPNAVRLMRNDMLKHGVESGLLKASNLPGDPARWRTFFGALKEGVIAEEAAVRAFADDPAIGLAKRIYDAEGLSDGKWILSRLADDMLGDGGTLAADLKGKLTTSFSDKLARTHDAIILPGENGQWQVIALRPETLHTPEGGIAKGVATMHEAYTALRHDIYKRSDAMLVEADKIGTDLNVVLGDYQNVEKTFLKSSARMSEIEQQIRHATGLAGETLDFELNLRSQVDRLSTAATSHRNEAARLRNVAQTLTDHAAAAKAFEEATIEDLLARAAEAKAVHHALEADLLKQSKSIAKHQARLDSYSGRVAKRLQENIAQTGRYDQRIVRDPLTDQMRIAMRQLSQDVYAPNNIVQAIVDMQRVFGHPDGAAGALRAFDKVTNIWKAQAMTRPGFHIRNAMGGMINNWIGNVESSAYKDFMTRFSTYERVLKDGGAHADGIAAVLTKHGFEDAAKMQSIVERGVVTGGQSAETRIIGGMHSGNLNPLSQNFKLYKKNSEAMAWVENRLRGAMAWDRLTKGVSGDAMLADVARYHFDYDDLSRFERNFVRRIVPFYTWTRKNFPLQVEMMLENPKHITRFMNLKRDIEEVTPDEATYPSWFNNELTVRLPFASGQTANYVMPDAPFKDMAGFTSPSKWLEQVNPIFKTPIEMKTGVKFFGNIPFKGGYQGVPSVWSDVGIPQVLSKFGKARKDANGDWVMRDKDLYMVEQFVPLLGQARRLAPYGGVASEKKFSDRLLFSWASFAFGQTARQNTAADQKSEYTRRSEELKKLTADLKSTGYLATKGK